MRGYPIFAKVKYKDSKVDISFDVRVKKFMSKNNEPMYCFWTGNCPVLDYAYVLNRYTAMKWKIYKFRFSDVSTRSFQTNLTYATNSMLALMKQEEAGVGSHIDKVTGAEVKIQVLDVDSKILDDMHDKYLKNKLIKNV